MTKEIKDDIFNEANIPESSWFKFEKVGDRISGEVVAMSEKKSNNPTFPDQRVFEIKKNDGEIVNVGIKTTSDYLMTRTKNVKPGDMIGFEFKKEVPPKVKGYSPAKSIEVYVKHCEVDTLAEGM
jgi:co-chaperonin GroES (HSP10)